MKRFLTALSLCMAIMAACAKDAIPLQVGGPVRIRCDDSTRLYVNQTCTYNVENPFIASVSDGVVRGCHVGTTSIYVSTLEGEEVVMATVDVLPRITGIPEAEDLLGRDVANMISILGKPVSISDGYYHFTTEGLSLISAKIEKGIVSAIFFVSDDQDRLAAYLDERYERVAGLYRRGQIIAARRGSVVIIKLKS